MGRYLEDFRVGEVIKHWPGRTIRDFDGTLVFALAVGMSVRDVSENAIANLEYEKVVHHAPTFHGDTLYAESEVLEVTPSSKPDRGVVYVETRALNQRGEKVLSL